MKGIIYKIYDNTNGNLYYGSTSQKLSRRIALHRAIYKNGGNCSSGEIIKNGDYSYSLVEEVEFENKLILHQRERYYIENFDCINKNIPSRTPKEYLEANKERKQEYYQANQKKRQETSRQYYHANKEKVKQYYQANKEKIKEYYQAKKEKIEAKIICECGCEVRKSNINRHKKSKKHIDRMNNI